MHSDLRRLTWACVLLTCGLSLAEPLVGPSVGRGDALLAEGTRLYNKRKHKDAAKVLLQATRANPSLLPAYLGLARARMGAKDVPGACAAYRAYVRSAPDIQDRTKAQRELALCERKLKAARRKKRNKVPPDMTARHVELKAGFFAALEEGRLVGPGAAGETLRTLVSEGYLGTDLGDMAARLSAASQATTDDLHQRALAGEALPRRACGSPARSSTGSRHGGAVRQGRCPGTLPGRARGAPEWRLRRGAAPVREGRIRGARAQRVPSVARRRAPACRRFGRRADGAGDGPAARCAHGRAPRGLRPAEVSRGGSSRAGAHPLPALRPGHALTAVPSPPALQGHHVALHLPAVRGPA
ncbi:hypothetical protein QEG98_24765 [Myxococcus sp. MxC21-1]|nr:hypothetical protein [Myxococcus sp. MxC21-1]WNZ59294.1 hypothetical protein QEG98_24765 [Myxococcus sp. MxC21-1]